MFIVVIVPLESEEGSSEVPQDSRAGVEHLLLKVENSLPIAIFQTKRVTFSVSDLSLVSRQG